jgi:hypothetical protein
MSTTRLTKIDIATLQLNHAIDLFLEDRELVSAITLAGAAEEILGKLVERYGFPASLTRKVNSTRDLYRHLWNHDVGNKPFINLKNKTRNELKHLISGDAIDIDLSMRSPDGAQRNPG